jgi:hypothetical protein
MNEFSLASRVHPIALPETVEWQGKEYPIRTDFRAVLLAIKLMGDPNIAPTDRRALLADILFPGCVPHDPWAAVQPFIRRGRTDPPEPGARDFDYEQDAAEIYAAFMQVYGIDLIDAPHMHWWKFCALLDGVFACDNALSNKVCLRRIDDNEGARKAAMDRAKRNVRLAEEVSAADAAIDRRIRERLLAGKPIDDLLKG